MSLNDRIRALRSELHYLLQYSPEWYQKNTELAALVREWRKSNTLRGV